MAATRQSSAPAAPLQGHDDAEVRALSIDTIRALSMDAVQKANAGHPGTAMALAPLAYILFKRFLRVNPQDTEWPDRDRFVLSCGPRLRAAVLAAAPLRLRPRRSTTCDSSASGARARPGHPERGHTPGIEVTTGPLGQGVANAVGMAIAERFLAERFNRPAREIVDHRHLRDLLRRRHDGGRQPGSGLDRRALRPRQADRLLRRQPHHDRRHHRAVLRRREPHRALRRRRLARAARRGLRGPRRAGGGDHGGARGTRAAVLHRDPLAHRLPRAERDRTRPRPTARRSARTRCAPRRS